MALQDNTLKVVEADNVQFAVIKSWGKMKWNKGKGRLEGIADLELLDKMASLVQLPPPIEEHRQRLHRVQEAVDRERVNPSPTPMYQYPVKLPLYAHQVRGANMALMTFGLIEPPPEVKKE